VTGITLPFPYDNHGTGEYHTAVEQEWMAIDLL
jgi:hypothetical protein